MALQIFSKAGAFSPGAQLWIIPQLDSSQWTKTIDWYLNFQVSRMETHSPKTISDTLKEIVKASETESPTTNITDQAPLLVASSSRLPNDQTVVLPFEEKIDDWFNRIKSIWYNLNRPPMRVFLPVDVKESEIMKHWPNLEEQHLVSFVPNITKASH